MNAFSKLLRVFAGPYFFAHGFEALVALGIGLPSPVKAKAKKD